MFLRILLFIILMNSSACAEELSSNLLGYLRIGGDDSEISASPQNYPCQRDSFSLPPDWRLGDEIDLVYLRTNVCNSFILRGLSMQIVEGRTSVYNEEDGILSLFQFRILLDAPVWFSLRNGRASRIESISYISKSVKVSPEEFQKILFPLDLSDCSSERFQINYQNRAPKRLCVEKRFLPHSYFPKGDVFKGIDLLSLISIEEDSGYSAEILQVPFSRKERFNPPENFWIKLEDDFREIIKNTELEEWKLIGFKTVADGKTDILMNLSTIFSFDPSKGKVLTQPFFPANLQRQQAADFGSFFALEGLLSYWEQISLNDFRVDYFHFILKKYKEELESDDKK